MSLFWAATSVAGSWQMNFGRILQQLMLARRRRLTAKSSSIARALKSMLAGEASARRGKASLNGFCSALESLEVRQVLSESPLLIPGEFFGHDPVPDSADWIPEIADSEEEASQFPGEALPAEWSLIEQDIHAQQFRDQLTLVLESLPDGTDSTSEHDAWRQLLAGDWNSTVFIAPEADSSFNPFLPFNTTAESVIEIEFDWTAETQSFRVTPITSGGFRIELLGLGNSSLAGFDPDQAVSSPDFSTSGFEPSNDPEPTIDEPNLPSVLIDQVFDGSGLLDRLSGIADQRPTSSLAASRFFANSEPAPPALILNQQRERSLAGPAQRSVSLSPAETETLWWQRSAAMRMLTRGWEWLGQTSGLQAETSRPGTFAVRRTVPELSPGYGGRSSGRTSAEKPGDEPASTRKAVGHGMFCKVWHTDEESRLFVVLSEAVPLFSATTSPVYAELSAGASPAVVRRMRDGNRQGFGGEVLESIVRSNDEPPDRIETDSYPRELKYVVNPRAPPSGSRDPELRVVVEEASADLLRRLRYSIAPRGPSLVTVETQSPEFQSFSGPRVSSEVRWNDLVC